MEVLLCACKSRLISIIQPNLISVRAYKYTRSPKLLGVAPYEGKSLAQKLEEAEYNDPAIYFKVNIGLPQVIPNRKEVSQKRIAHFKSLKNDPDLEKKARENKISLSFEDVTKEWICESASEHIKLAAEHYGIFQDLFGDAYFYPDIILDVAFKNSNLMVPVRRGNTIKPSQALTAPEVIFPAEQDSLWTLIATNPDGHLHQENVEYLHWFVGNISGNNLSQGSVIADYVQPFPPRGTGFQRLVFTLYKQSQEVDYSSFKKLSADNVSFNERAFSTYEFYCHHEAQLTPAGLAFCQVDWDPSVSQFFHTILEVEEPIYEYDFEPHYYSKQKYFPIRQPFNLYLDRYRDSKQIAKEYLLKKLSCRHPFEPPKPALKYPNSVPVYHDLDEKLHGRIPSWLKLRKLKERMGHGRINDY